MISWDFYGDLMGFNGISWDFYGDLMAFSDPFMVLTMRFGLGFPRNGELVDEVREVVADPACDFHGKTHSEFCHFQ